MKRKLNRKAFTLVELLVVIAILAILSTVAVIGYTAYIKNAHVSNDQKIASELSDVLRAHLVDHDINSEADLKAAIAKYAGDDFFVNLSPESAEYGYHFWYDVTNKKIIVAKPDEVGVEVGFRPFFVAHAAGTSGKGNTFAPNSVRVFKGNGDNFYYLLDQVNEHSETVGFINTLEDPKMTSTDYQNILNTCTDTALLENMNYIAIHNETGVHTQDASQVEAIYYPEGLTSLGENNGYSFPNVENVEIPNIIPTTPSDPAEPTVPVYPEGSLSYITNPSANVSMKVEENDANALATQLGEQFKTSDIQSGLTITITTSDGTQFEFKYDVDENGDPAHVIVNVEDNSIKVKVEIEVVYKESVTSFDVTSSGVTVDEKVKVNVLSNQIYVAYDYTSGSFKLIPGNFNNGNAVSSTDVTWSVSHEDYISVANDGTVTIKKALIDGITITATAKAGGLELVIPVNVVRVKSAIITLDGAAFTLDNQSINNNTIEWSFTGDNNQMIFGTTFSDITYTNEDEDGNVLVDCDIALDFSTSNTVFTETNGVLELTQTAFGTQTITITVGSSISDTFTVNVTDNSATPFELKNIVDGLKIGQGYLFRVGNGNTFTLGALFTNTKPADSETLTIYDVSKTVGTTRNTITKVTDASEASGFCAIYSDTITKSNWSTQTIRFFGTGVAIIKLGAVELAVEVVDAENISSGSLSSITAKNVVLLSDVKAGVLTLTNSIVYGNGFKIDIAGAKNTEHGIIYLKNATLNNVRIIGDVYESYGSTYNSTNHAAAVYSESGNNSIIGSYISGCASPVLQSSTSLHIEDTTLYGGTYCNLAIGGGDVTLKNVVTFNQTTDNRGVVGLGIVISDVTEYAKITLEGTLKQYNFVSSSDASKIKDTYGKELINEIFEGKYDAYKFADGFINTGIISMNENIVLSNSENSSLIDNRTNKQNYVCMAVSVSKSGVTVKGYACSPQPATTSENSYRNDYVETDRKQGAFVPKFEINLGNQEISYDGETDDRYCYYDNGTLKVLYKQGSEAISLDLSTIATVSKYSGQSFNAINGGFEDADENTIAITNNTVTFSEAGTYYITLTITDNVMYDQNGNASAVTVDHTYTIPVTVEIIKGEHKNASISLGGSTLTSYINKTGSFWDYDYGFAAPVFNKLVIKDYDEAGNETTLDLMSYTSVTVTGEVNAGGTITLTYSNNRTLVITYTGTSAMGNDKNQRVLSAKKYNNTLYIITTGGTDKKDSVNGNITFTSYSFTGANGKTITLNESVVNTFTSSLSEKTTSNFKNP